MVIRTRRFVDSLFALMPLRLALWAWLVFYVWPGLFTDAHALVQHMDDHQFYNWEEAARSSVVRWHQLPLWNPYYCGGMVLGAAPEDGAFAPDFLLRIIFGVAHGRRLAILLFAVVGMEGTYRLVRRLDGSAIAGVFAAAMFVFHERMIGFLNQGWVNFCGFYLLPWVVLALIAGRTSWSWRFVGALFLGWIALAAGTYTTPYTGIALGYLSVVLLVSALVAGKWRTSKATLITAAVIGAGAILVALVKLLPMGLVMREFPRVFTPTEINDPWTMVRGAWAIHSAVISLAVIAVLTGDRWARVFFGATILFVALAMGQFASWAPSAILRKLPLVSGLRFPDRFMIMAHFFAVFAAARGVTRLEDLGARSFRGIGRVGARLVERFTPLRLRAVAALGIAGATLAAAALAGLLLRGEAKLVFDALIIRPHAHFTLEGPREIAQDFKQARGNRRDAHVFPPMNRGSLYCFAMIPVPDSALLRADLPQEEYSEKPGAANVVRKSWSPNEIVLDVDAPAPARIFVNQNFSPRWKSDVGTVVAVEKLLAIDVPSGKHTVTLTYVDRLTMFCLFVSIATALGMLGYIGCRRARIWRAALVDWRELGAFSLLRRDPKKSDEPVDGANAKAALAPEPSVSEEASKEERENEDPSSEPTKPSKPTKPTDKEPSKEKINS